MKLRLMFAYAWVIAPVLAIVAHYAWGKQYLRQDRLWDDIAVAVQLEEAAMESVTVESLEKAETAYSQVIETLGEKDSKEFEAQVLLARTRCTLYKGKLVSAMMDLQGQLDSAVKKDVSQEVQRDIRETLARCLFGIAWVMRNEGSSQEHWTRVADDARQHFRYLAEVAPNEEEHKRCAKNLEIAIRLERLDTIHPWLEKLKKQAVEVESAVGASPNARDMKELLVRRGTKTPE
jgi:hypothetical protein